MPKKLPEELLRKLRTLECELRKASQRGKPEEAIELATQIQALFGSDRTHHRLLQAKLWAFEACLDENRLNYAERGFIGVRRFASQSTRIYLEATALLSICMLRSKKTEEAKPLISEVVSSYNNIKSDERRRQFQKRFISRIEEECILSELIGAGDEKLEPQFIHEKAVQLLQQNNEIELEKLIGNLLPASSVKLLAEVRDHAILKIPPPDQKFLPPKLESEKPKNLGKRAMAVLRRIGWKTLCDPDSSIYKAWAERMPKVYNEAFFATALATTFANWKIGLPLLVSGVVAITMKYTAHDFCETTKPEGMLIPKNKK